MRARHVVALAPWALAAHAVVNARLLRTPPSAQPVERFSVLLPVRDEVDGVTSCVTALLRALPDDAELVVLDDGSSDGTAEAARRAADQDPRVHVLAGAPLPEGWLGKPHACQQLADAADPRSTVLVFVDADVRVAPDGLVRTVAQLRATGLDLVSPYPRQLADGPLPRLVQPLLQWSWLTFLPLRAAERSPRPSLSAANGQLLAVDRAAYGKAGGHAAVRNAVIDDIALLRAVKASGGRGVVTDGTDVATCRMYDDAAALTKGYEKSAGVAFGSAAGAVGVMALLHVLFVLPVALLVKRSTRRAGLVGYAGGVAGRMVSARRTGGRVWPDPLAHPVSIVALGRLTALSLRRRRRGTATWKGRPVT